MILLLASLYGNNRSNKPACQGVVQKEPECPFRRWNILPHTSFWGQVRSLCFYL